MKINDNFARIAWTNPVRMGTIFKDQTFTGHVVPLAELEIDIICRRTNGSVEQVTSEPRLSEGAGLTHCICRTDRESVIARTLVYWM